MRSLLFAALLCLGALPLAARQVPTRLALEDAIRIAESRSPTYRIALNSLDRAEIGERRAFRNTFFPRFDTSLGFGGSSYRTFTAEDFDGSVLPSPRINEGRSSVSRQNFNVGMTLFSGPSYLGYRQAQLDSERIGAQVDASLASLRAEVTRRFYAAVQAEDAVAMEHRLLDRARENMEVVEKRFGVGIQELADVLGARLEYADRQIQLERARAEAYKARLALLQSMGVEGEPPFELVGTLPEPFDPERLDVERWVSAALDASPRVRVADASMRSSAASSRVARALRWPTLSAAGSLGRERTTPDFASFFELNPRNWRYNLSLTLSVPIPLLRFDQSASIALADISQADAEQSLRRERLAVESEVRAQIVDLRIAFANIRMAEQRADLSRQRVELLEEQFRGGGRIDFLRLEQAWDQAAQAERSVLAARITFQNLLLGLDQLVGLEARP